jgi:hypothetical protein
METIGIDVHKVSQVCIRTEDGAFVEQRIATTRRCARNIWVGAPVPGRRHCIRVRSTIPASRVGQASRRR